MSGAFAAENSELTTSDLGAIEIVATKVKSKKNESMANTIQQTGQSLPALSVTESTPENGFSTQQTLENMSGVMIQGGTQTMSQSISVGGLTGDQVYVAIDGVNNQFSNFRQGYNQSRILPNPFLYKSVEASAGGNNITYGSGNVGGSVNFTTVDPDDFLQGDNVVGGQVTGGGQSGAPGWNAGGAAAARLNSVSILFDMIGDQSGNIRLGDGSTLSNSASKDLQYLGKLVWDMTNDQKFTLSFLSMQNVGDYPLVTNRPVSANNPATAFNFFQTQSMAEYTYNPNNPYVDFKFQGFYNQNHMQAYPSSSAGGRAFDTNVLINNYGLRTQNTSTTYEQHLLYGIDYQYIEGKDQADNGATSTIPSATQQLYSVFLQDSWDIIESLNITVGGRANGYSSTDGNSSNQGVIFTKQASVTYEIIEDWKVYVGYNEGFRVPTIQELYISGNYPSPADRIFIANPNLSPEQSNIKTIGTSFKQDISSEQWFELNGSFFLNDVNNYILTSAVEQRGSTQVRQYVNISKAQLYGYELAGSYHTPWFILSSNFTYVRGKTQSSYTDRRGNEIPAGDPLPVPRAKGVVALDIPVEQIESNITAYLNYAISQSYIPAGSNIAGDDYVPGYVIVGLNYMWQPLDMLKGLVLTLGVDNLLDQSYVNYGGGTGKNFNVLPAMGRNFYGQVTYQF
jgi:hemoglobin/transferrin/lactoferrin receptor protein